MTATTKTRTTALAPRADRVPPQDLDAEMALLGAMMLSRDAISEVIPIILPNNSGWFYVPAHQKLYDVLVELYDNPASAIDLITVSDELRRRNLYDYVGGHEYMIQLVESFGDYANAEHYAGIVKDKGMLRDLIRCAGSITEEAYSSIEPARDVLDRAERDIFEVTAQRISGETESIKEAVRRLAERLRDQDGVTTGLPSGFPRLDKMTTGFQPGDFVIIAGRPSMGKTALGLNMAQHAALVDKLPVLFFSMEMSADQLAQRLVSAHAGIESHKIRQQILSEKEQFELQNACHAFEDAPLFIDDTPGMTATEVRSKTRRLVQRHNIKAVYVDYLQLMHMPGGESRQAEISAISRSLKSLGRELKIPIIAMAQLNRMPEGRQDKRPLMSDLRESGAIEQDADVVLLIHREEYYKPEDIDAQGKAELIIAKQRNGPVGSVDLQFNKKLTRFNSLAMIPDQYEPADSGETPF